jgi:hypothetical protein
MIILLNRLKIKAVQKQIQNKTHQKLPEDSEAMQADDQKDKRFCLQFVVYLTALFQQLRLYNVD